MQFTKTNTYDKNFVEENMMGPNALKVLEELTANFQFKPNMRVLDLCCGKGLTSIFLAKEFGCQVFATDLWIPASENYEKIRVFDLEDKIIPIHTDALKLPYAEEYFDAIVCVDGYHYFGREEGFIDEKILPYLKKDGDLLFAFPGLKENILGSFGELPPVMFLSWEPEELECMKPISWWKNLLASSQAFKLEKINELTCFEEAWADWLKLENPYSIEDRKAMNEGASQYMNIIALLGKKAL